MKQLINKNVFIHALQFDGTNLEEIEEFTEFTNVLSVTILNNVLYIIYKSYDHAEPQRMHAMPRQYLIKDAAGYVSIYDEDIINQHWYEYKAGN